MRFRDRDAERLELPAVASEIARARVVCDAIEDVFGEKFGGRVDALELGYLIKVAVVQRLEHHFQDIVGAADIDDDAVTVEVRDHIMIAHSFRGEVFGPAQALHGATFVVDAAFISKDVDKNNIVIDIGRAHDALKAILQPLNYKNLDDVPDFKGQNTTTEFLTRHIYNKLAEDARAGKLGRDGKELKAIRVTISESHVARASYEADLW